MDEKLLIQKYKRAQRYAGIYGHGELATDFASWLVVDLLENPKSEFRLMYHSLTIFLREWYGRMELVNKIPNRPRPPTKLPQGSDFLYSQYSLDDTSLWDTEIPDEGFKGEYEFFVPEVTEDPMRILDYPRNYIYDQVFRKGRRKADVAIDLKITRAAVSFHIAKIKEKIFDAFSEKEKVL